MQPVTEELEIKLETSAGDYHVPGFSDGYATYLKGCFRGAEYYGGLVTVTGFVIALMAFAALVLGPEIVFYDRGRGPTLLQYLQMYPGPIFSVGGALFMLGTQLYAKKALSRELFLLSCYKLIAPDGKFVTCRVELRYLGGDNFTITIP